MAAPDAMLQQFASCFLQTLSPEPEPRRQAEAFLKQAGSQSGYGMTVLRLVASNTDGQIRQAAAVNFKNHIKYRWQPPETDPGAASIDDSEKEQIKALITDLMLSTPPKIQAQLSEALAIISQHDFPKRWPSLLPALVNKLQTTDYNVINGVLQTANSIFKRFRHQYKSNELYEELKYVLDAFVAPMLDLFKRTSQAIAASQASAPTLRDLFNCQRLICRIFFSLNSQELPEVFEDHMAEWMAEFHTYLTYENPLLNESDPEKESVVDQTKAAVCQNINLYMEKNEEEFQSYLPTFATDVWNLLMKVGTEPSHDRLVTTAIRFLTTVSKSVHHPLFSSPDVLKKICESIVIPNIKMRDEDEELFEMNWVEYIRRDMEGSDADTRRRMACELVKGLMEHYEPQVTALFGEYVGSMLTEAAGGGAAAWKAKDCAIYFVLALTVRQKTAAHGATATNQLVNVGDFFSQHIQPELQSGEGPAVLKADALKFLTTFRSQVPKAACLALLPNLAGFLTSDQNVVHTYAAHCIERLLVIKDGPTHRFTKQDTAPLTQLLLTNLFNALKLPESAENDYVMKCIMRLISNADILPLAPHCLSQLAAILAEVAKNPTHPGFNHYLFESIAALIQRCCSHDASQAAAFESLLFPVFQAILEQDVSEFHPYVFQILSLLAEERPAPLPEAYMAIFRPLLTPSMWERSANVPALVRLLQAYLQKAPTEVVAGNHLPAVLGIFQKLVASKHSDHHAFFILNTVVENLPLQVLSQYVTTVWKILFYRLQNSITVKFLRSFIVFMSLFIAKHGPVQVLESIDTLQGGLSTQVLESFWVHKEGSSMGDASTISGDVETKVVASAVTKLLCVCPPLLAEERTPLWGRLLATVLLLLGKPQEEKDGQDEEDCDHHEGGGYSATYAHLHHAHKHDIDPLPDIKDPQQYLVSSLAKLGASSPGKLPSIIGGAVPPATQSSLSALCSKYGVSLA